jgi:hypothetical protein
LRGARGRSLCDGPRRAVDDWRWRSRIRRFYAQLLDARPTFEPAEQLPALMRGDLALTSTRLVGGGATAEVARRQPDGTWLWIIDRPNVIS